MIAAGTVIGPYEVIHRIASGGMGTVYRGRHTELDRTVAIKVVSDEIAGDPVSARRFRREARAASRLNHPNICTVHDFHSDGETHFLIMEYLEGETLEARMRRQRLQPDEVLRIAAEVAEAMGHAHGMGLVHRDLKPGNIMLTPAGAKVLDFGAVRRTPAEEDGSHGLSWTDSLTEDGHLVGTLPYMSPEQIEGEELDGRSDIYALGVIMYEMVTGRRPYRSGSPAALAAAIVQGNPVPVESLEPDLSPILARLVERCMAKRREDRWQNAQDLASELRWLVDSGETLTTESRRLRAERERRTRRTAAIGTVVGVAGIAALSFGLFGSGGAATSAPAGSLSLYVQPPDGVGFTEQIAALAPDGRRLAFSGTSEDGEMAIWVQDLSRSEARRLPNSTNGLEPFWSPGGDMVGYFSGRQLRTVDVAGGPSRVLAPASPDSRGGDWNEAGIILFGPEPRTGLHAVEADGGVVRQVTEPDRERAEIGHLWPSFLPDGEHFICYVSSTQDSVRGIYAGSLEDGLLSRLLSSNGAGTYRDGHLFFEREGALFVQPLDPDALELGGAPVRLLDDVATNFQHRPFFSVSPAGPLLYSPSGSGYRRRLELYNREGRQIRSLGPEGHQRNPDVSPDGRRIAIEVFDDSNGQLWIMDLQTGRSRRLATGVPQGLLPAWHPDGTTLAFASNEDGGSRLFVVDVERSEPPTRLLRSPHYIVPTEWSRDGRTLVYAERDESGQYDLLMLEVSPPQDPTPLLASRHTEINAQFSPSGGRVAYVSGESGEYHVYVETFPRSGPRCQVSADLGWQPSWGADDDELYFLNGRGDVMQVEVGGLSPCDISRPEPLFRSPIANPSQSRSHYAYIPQLDQFVFNAPSEAGGGRSLRFIVDWREFVNARQEP